MVEQFLVEQMDQVMVLAVVVVLLQLVVLEYLMEQVMEVQVQQQVFRDHRLRMQVVGVEVYLILQEELVDLVEQVVVELGAEEVDVMLFQEHLTLVVAVVDRKDVIQALLVEMAVQV